MIDVKEFTEHNMGIMRGLIESGKAAHPIVFALRAGGQIDVIEISDMVGEAGKDRVAKMLQRLFDEPDVACVVYLADSYMKEGGPIIARLKDVPGRFEAITATVHGKGIKASFAHWRYDRVDGKPQFREIQWSADNVRVAGRFAPEGAERATH